MAFCSGILYIRRTILRPSAAKAVKFGAVPGHLLNKIVCLCGCCGWDSVLVGDFKGNVIVWVQELSSRKSVSGLSPWNFLYGYTCFWSVWEILILRGGGNKVLFQYSLVLASHTQTQSWKYMALTTQFWTCYFFRYKMKVWWL